jgi:hypothetical protein
MPLTIAVGTIKIGVNEVRFVYVCKYNPKIYIYIYIYKSDFIELCIYIYIYKYIKVHDGIVSMHVCMCVVPWLHTIE